jgi:D-aminopeptidase
MRARDLGIVIGQLPTGPLNALTDVAGIRVGHTTLVEGEGPLRVGHGPVRTGVTVIVPHDGPSHEALYAGAHTLNGNGEMTGLAWIAESGMLTTPIGLTNTHSVGMVHHALIEAHRRAAGDGANHWSLPVVAETWDGYLNDVDGQHVRAEHVFAALAGAAGGPVAEGNVGGGTGMKAFGFKAGIGTASRVVADGDDSYAVGVLVQANHGARRRLRIDGVPVGEEVGVDVIPWLGTPVPPEGAGSVIGIVATDAPLLPHQCRRLAQRASLGVAMMGAAGENSSGDLFLAFATGNRGLTAREDGVERPPTASVTTLNDAHIDSLFYAVIEGTEEAVVNALLAAETMTGRDGITAKAIPHDLLTAVMERYGRLRGRS